MKRDRQPAAAGFTIIELMIIVALVAIVLALAAPSFSKMIQMQRLKSASAELVTNLQFARSEAVSRQEWVGLSVGGTAARSCYVVFACGTSTTANCTCNCASDPVACANGVSVIRQVDWPMSAGIKLLAMGPNFSGSGALKALFDPATGGLNSYYLPPLSITSPVPPNELWLQFLLIGPGMQPGITTITNPTGRPSSCSRNGLVNGVTPCP